MHLAALVFALFVTNVLAVLSPAKIFCYYDHSSFHRRDDGKFTTADLENALPKCTHVVYGYAKLDTDFKIKSNDKDLDTDSGKGNFRAITGLKKRFPSVQFLVSMGTWADDDDESSDKYLEMLRDPKHRATFINSAKEFVTKYGFDGLDLAWQFPLIPVKQRSTLGSIWHKIKKTVGASKGSKDEQANEHKAGYTALVKDLRRAFKAGGQSLTATVIPHTNYTLYYDLPEISPQLDAIILQAYDFMTPKSKISPEVADYPAPLFASYDRHPLFNIDSEVRWFLEHGAPANKLILGIATYGRTWKLTSSSSKSGVPPLEAEGKGEEGPLTREKGILSFPEICTIFQDPKKFNTKSVLKRVTDPNKKLGTYAYRTEGDKEGLWVGYEEPETVTQKAQYVRDAKLAGVAMVDITMDDFKGTCLGHKYPLLKAAYDAF